MTYKLLRGETVLTEQADPILYDEPQGGWSVGRTLYCDPEKLMHTEMGESTLLAHVATLKTSALIQIDADTDAIYGDVLGHRAQEYALAESDAASYRAAGYTGTVQSSVQSWAVAKGWTATQAADNILITAAQWRGAQAAIRSNRLMRKEEVRVAVDATGISAELTAWAGFVAGMRSQLGL